LEREQIPAPTKRCRARPGLRPRQRAEQRELALDEGESRLEQSELHVHVAERAQHLDAQRRLPLQLALDPARAVVEQLARRHRLPARL